MTSEDIQRWHNRLLIAWGGPGMALSVVLVLVAGTKVILIWNLAISVYTILMTHYLGRRQEQDNDL